MSSLWFLFYIFRFIIWYKEQSKEKQKSSLTQDVRGQLHRQGAQFMLFILKTAVDTWLLFLDKRDAKHLALMLFIFPPTISMKNRKAINNLLERKQRNAKNKIKGEWKSKRLYFNESKEHHWDILCCFCCFYTSSLMYVCVWMYVQCTILSLYYYYYFRRVNDTFIAFHETRARFTCTNMMMMMHKTYTIAFTARPYISKRNMKTCIDNWLLLFVSYDFPHVGHEVEDFKNNNRKKRNHISHAYTHLSHQLEYIWEMH